MHTSLRWRGSYLTHVGRRARMDTTVALAKIETNSWIMVNWICSEIFQSDDLLFGGKAACFSDWEKGSPRQRTRSYQPSKITRKLHASVFGSHRFSGGFHRGISAWNSSSIEVCGQRFFVGSRISSFSLHVKSKPSQNLEKNRLPRSW